MITTKNSQLEKWLKDKKMSTNRFVELVGCSRPVIWKVKRGIAICPLYAKRVFDLTNGNVQPICEKVGRPW